MSNNIILSDILDIEDLPSPPSVASRLLDLYSDASINEQELATAISADPILSARVMTYANSPTVNSGSEITSIKDAISLLGARTIKTISLSFSVTQPKSTHRDVQFNLDDFWNCSLVRAVAAKVLCKKFDHDAEFGFLCGLMLEVGELALAHSSKLPGQILEQYPQLKTSRPFTICHADDPFDYYRFGGYLLREWKFPLEVIEAISTLCSNERPSEIQKTLMLAAGIGKMIFDNEYEFDQIQQVKDFAANKLQLTNDQFENVFAEVLDSWISNSMVLQRDESRSIEEIEKEAKKQITHLSLDLQQENQLISEENQNLREQAMVDSLTGLGNRRAWEQVCQAEWERASRSGCAFSIMVIDIDHFKQVNDTHGHAVGDMCLAHVATMLDQNIRKYDQVFRFGGEEFVVMLPNCQMPMTHNVAKRLLKCVEDAPIQFAGKTIPVTISIGISQWNMEMHHSIDQMFEAADQQLYKAKNGGRNQYCIDAPETIST